LKLLVTGGAGFIGSNFVRHMLTTRPDVHIVNFDKLTYAGNPESLSDLASDPRYRFIRGDITDSAAVAELFALGFDALVNFAAETHVDRSIEDASPFLRTNVGGVMCLLEAARKTNIKLPIVLRLEGTNVDEGKKILMNSGFNFTVTDTMKDAADRVVAAARGTAGVTEWR